MSEELLNIHVFYKIPKKDLEQFKKDLKKYSKWLSVDRTLNVNGQKRTSVGRLNTCTTIKNEIIKKRIVEHLMVNKEAKSKVLYDIIKKKNVIKYRNFTRLLEKLCVVDLIDVRKKPSITGGYENIWFLTKVGSQND